MPLLWVCLEWTAEKTRGQSQLDNISICKTSTGVVIGRLDANHVVISTTSLFNLVTNMKQVYHGIVLPCALSFSDHIAFVLKQQIANYWKAYLLDSPVVLSLVQRTFEPARPVYHIPREPMCRKSRKMRFAGSVTTRMSLHQKYCKWLGPWRWATWQVPKTSYSLTWSPGDRLLCHGTWKSSDHFSMCLYLVLALVHQQEWRVSLRKCNKTT